MWQELTTAIDAHEAKLPARDQACRVANEELLLAVTLDRTVVVYDPIAPDRGRWLVGRAAVEVDAEATRWVPGEQLEGKRSGWNRYASWPRRGASGRDHRQPLGSNPTLSASGAQTLLGNVAVIVRRIDGGQHRGHAQIFGEHWPAISIDGTPIDVGTEVRIVELRGATLVAEPSQAPALPGALAGSDHPDPDDPGQ
jgi:hypothetical protein